MSQVRCVGKQIRIEVEHNGATYECLFCDSLKNMFECDPEPENWVQLENLVREAAWRGEIENLELLG